LKLHLSLSQCKSGVRADPRRRLQALVNKRLAPPPSTCIIIISDHIVHFHFQITCVGLAKGGLSEKWWKNNIACSIDVEFKNPGVRVTGWVLNGTCNTYFITILQLDMEESKSSVTARADEAIHLQQGNAKRVSRINNTQWIRMELITDNWQWIIFRNSLGIPLYTFSDCQMNSHVFNHVISHA